MKNVQNEINSQIKSKTNRYFPGKVPNFQSEEEPELKSNTVYQYNPKKSITEYSTENTSIKSEIVNDRRLNRIQQLTNDNSLKDRNEQRLKIRREIYKSEVVESSEKKDDNEKQENKVSELQQKLENQNTNEIDDEILKRRQNNTKINENIDENIENELDELINKDDQQDEPVNNEIDEDETDEKLLKPVFVSKEDRLTIKERLEKQMEEKAIEEQLNKLKENKKKETKQLVLTYIQKELNGELDEKNAEEIDMPDDTDDLDNTEEYEQWKIRELKRIRKNEEDNLQKLREKEEIERRRNLTDSQRNEENIRLGSDDTIRPFKSKYKFMQKYYSPGVFFQDQKQGNLEHIFNRDYNLPVGEDKFDKSSLPSILQKRRGLFGKKGQSKYTHLTNEDTTCHDPDYKVPENISKRLTNSLGGYKGSNSFEKPGKRK